MIFFQSFHKSVLFLFFFILLQGAGKIFAQPAARPIDLDLPATFLTEPDKIEDRTPDSTLLKTLQDLTHATPAGDTIYVCIFKFNLRSMAEAELRIAMGKWGGKRAAIINQLEELAERGATVEILLSTANGKQIKEKIRAVEAFRVTKLKKKEFNLHTKYLLIEATFGKSPRRLLLTGSANFTGRSLYENFEIILEVRDEHIYQQYLDHFRTLREL